MATKAQQQRPASYMEEALDAAEEMQERVWRAANEIEKQAKAMGNQALAQLADQVQTLATAIEWIVAAIYEAHPRAKAKAPQDEGMLRWP